MHQTADYYTGALSRDEGRFVESLSLRAPLRWNRVRGRRAVHQTGIH